MMRKLFFVIILLFSQSTFLYAQEGMRDIKAPLSIPFSGIGLIVFFVLILLLLAGGIWFFLKRERKPQVKKEIKIDPWVIANQRLSTLLEKNYHGLGDFDRFFSELSYIVRQYIEARFCIHAAEMTTPEFLMVVKNDHKLTLEQKQVLREFLDCCDMVKFAKYGPTDKEVDHSIVVTQRFIKETTIAVENKQEVVHAV